MIQDQQFLRQTASDFLQDMRMNQSQQTYQIAVNQYDQVMYEHLKVPIQNQPGLSIFQQDRLLMMPKSNTLVDHFMRNTFVEDQNSLALYNTMQAPPKPPPPIPPQPDQMDRTLGKSFVPLSRNYLEFNANTKQFQNTNGTGTLGYRQQYLTETDGPMFHRNQLDYMQGLMPQETNQDQVKSLKNNIQFLGGIEDTVGNMQDSLNNYEIRHLINKNIRNYPNPFEKEAPPPPKAEDPRVPHPFLYNPAEDNTRYKDWFDNLKQPSVIEMQQTMQSAFQQTNQQPYIEQQYNQQQYQQYMNQQKQEHQANTFHSIQQSKELRQRKLNFLQQIQH